jgi:hypothetical protein
MKIPPLSLTLTSLQSLRLPDSLWAVNGNVNNATEITSLTAFPTTEKVTTPDGTVWWVNRLTGFGMCLYTGNGVAGRTINHPMNKILLMGWLKNRDASVNWAVYSHFVGPTAALLLNATNAAVTGIGYFNDTAPTIDEITLGRFSGSKR